MEENIEEFDELPEFTPTVGVWERLSEADKPIIMYGMGDGAEKILSVMDRYGIRPSGFMASDEFVRGHSFRGFRVKKLSEIEEEFSDFIVVICFGTQLPEVMDRITELSEKYETLVPDVPVAGEGLFDSDYISDHECDIMELKPLFADDKSREVFDALMKFRITGELPVLRGCETDKSEALELLKLGQKETYLDLGAYNGDTVEEFLRLTDKKFEKIIAVEPDRRNYAKLRRRMYALGSGVFEHINAAVCKEDGPVTFYAKSGRGASLSSSGTVRAGRAQTIDGRSVDSILGGKPATLIKYDVEGNEEEALLGSAETIKKYKPRLIVSLYHRTGDMVSLPLLVHSLEPGYKLYLRHHPYIPAWDTNLYCI